MNTDDVVIVAAARTPQGRLKGQLASLTAVQLGKWTVFPPRSLSPSRRGPT